MRPSRVTCTHTPNCHPTVDPPPAVVAFGSPPHTPAAPPEPAPPALSLPPAHTQREYVVASLTGGAIGAFRRGKKR